MARCGGDLADPLFPPALVRLPVKSERADWVPRIVHTAHPTPRLDPPRESCRMPGACRRASHLGIRSAPRSGPGPGAGPQRSRARGAVPGPLLPPGPQAPTVPGSAWDTDLRTRAASVLRASSILAWLWAMGYGLLADWLRSSQLPAPSS